MDYSFAFFNNLDDLVYLWLSTYKGFMKNIEKRIFVVGCSRSGTTLLQSLISSHPDIASYPESQLLYNVVGQAKYRLFGLRKENYLKHFYGNLRHKFGLSSRSSNRGLNKFLEDIQRQDLSYLIPKSIYAKDYIDAFLKILDVATLSQSKSLWIEKSPSHLNYIDILEKYIEEPVFIHIVRSATDNIASLYDAAQKYPNEWSVYKDINLCVTRWKIARAITQAHVSKNNHFIICYEDLVSDTRSIIEELFEFLEVSPYKGEIRNRSGLEKQIVLPEEEWKTASTQPIYNANGEKFKSVFNADQRQYIEQLLSEN